MRREREKGSRVNADDISVHAAVFLFFHGGPLAQGRV